MLVYAAQYNEKFVLKEFVFSAVMGNLGIIYLIRNHLKR